MATIDAFSTFAARAGDSNLQFSIWQEDLIFLFKRFDCFDLDWKIFCGQWVCTHIHVVNKHRSMSWSKCQAYPYSNPRLVELLGTGTIWSRHCISTPNSNALIASLQCSCKTSECMQTGQLSKKASPAQPFSLCLAAWQEEQIWAWRPFVQPTDHLNAYTDP